MAATEKVLAGLKWTTKSVEDGVMPSEPDIAQREQDEIQKALQLELPVVAASRSRPVRQMDGTGVDVKKETVGRQGRRKASRPILGKSNLECVFTRRGG